MEGPYSITAAATDKAGSTVTSLSPLTFTEDRTAPTIPTVNDPTSGIGYTNAQTS